MRGRRPKPTALKELEGNPGKRPLSRREPKPKGDLYAAPEWMTDSQREGWAAYAITHAPYGLLKQLDRSVLAIWVVAEDLHREAAEKIAQYGLLTKSPNAGLPLQSPYLAILNKQAQIMLKAGAELGFSPASRTRVQVVREIANNRSPGTACATIPFMGARSLGSSAGTMTTIRRRSSLGADWRS
jgi:P27 family predicted phage terminase small subunit